MTHIFSPVLPWLHNWISHLNLVMVWLYPFIPPVSSCQNVESWQRREWEGHGRANKSNNVAKWSSFSVFSGYNQGIYTTTGRPERLKIRRAILGCSLIFRESGVTIKLQNVWRQKTYYSWYSFWRAQNKEFRHTFRFILPPIVHKISLSIRKWYLVNHRRWKMISLAGTIGYRSREQRNSSISMVGRFRF